MSRLGWVLIVLLSVLLVVGWFFLIYQPTSEAIEDVRAETEQVRAQTAQALARAEELREVRRAAPEAESQLAAGELLIPEAAAIPSLFRQMQQAADDAGVRLSTITPSPPVVGDVGGVDMAVISVSMAIEGSYFQIVDLARRIEDPQLTPRAIQWRTASMTPSEFPQLAITLSGEVYARGTEALPMPEEPSPEEPSVEEPADGVETDDGAEDDPAAELEVDP